MKKSFSVIFVLIFLASCQSSKDAFTLKKKSSADEFLVEKKSPLVLPPSYGTLPKPEGEQVDKIEKDQDTIKNILTSNEDQSIKDETNTKATSIEKSILEKIK